MCRASKRVSAFREIESRLSKKDSPLRRKDSNHPCLSESRMCAEARGTRLEQCGPVGGWEGWQDIGRGHVDRDLRTFEALLARRSLQLRGVIFFLGTTL